MHHDPAVETKDHLLDLINRGEGALVLDVLKHTVGLWYALQYQYKARELCERIADLQPELQARALLVFDMYLGD